MKHVFLVGGHDDTFSHYQGLNLRFTVLQRLSFLGPHLQSLTESVYIVPDLNQETVLEWAKKVHHSDPIDFLFSFTEDGLFSAAFAARELSIDGIDLNACKICIDKAYMRAYLVGTPYIIDYAECNSSNDVEKFLLRHPAGIILKDPIGSGSENVFFVESSRDLRNIFETFDSRGSYLLAEEFIEGREVSVETLTIRNSHEVIAVTSKKLYRGSYAEQQHIEPAPELTEEEKYCLKGYCTELLNLIGYRHGPCHIEVKITPKGIKLIEINNRVGGNYIGQLVELTTGVNLFRETLSYFVDGWPSLEVRHSRIKYLFAASHSFFEYIEHEKINQILKTVDIIKLELEPSTCAVSVMPINDDILGHVVLASNDYDKFSEVITNLCILTD